MTSFTDDPDEWQRLDWQLLQNSAITLYFHMPVLEADAAWFAAHDYRVFSLRAGAYQSQEALLVELGKLLAERHGPRANR